MQAEHEGTEAEKLRLAERGRTATRDRNELCNLAQRTENTGKLVNVLGKLRAASTPQEQRFSPASPDQV